MTGRGHALGVAAVAAPRRSGWSRAAGVPAAAVASPHPPDPLPRGLRFSGKGVGARDTFTAREGALLALRAADHALSRRVVNYGYDAVGNRIRETEKDSTEAVLAEKQGVFDNANRLTELTDLVVPGQHHDLHLGQERQPAHQDDGGVTTENRYDLRDKLVEVVQGASTLGRFQYDAQGRRTLKIGEDGVSQYVYDQTSLLAEYDETGTQKAKYDYGSDRLISLTRADEGRRYFSLDGLRSVVNLTTTRAQRCQLPPRRLGQLPLPHRARTPPQNRFAFTGHIWDQETGLYNAKARYFDPKSVDSSPRTPSRRNRRPALAASVLLRERQPRSLHRPDRAHRPADARRVDQQEHGPEQQLVHGRGQGLLQGGELPDPGRDQLRGAASAGRAGRSEPRRPDLGRGLPFKDWGQRRLVRWTGSHDPRHGWSDGATRGAAMAWGAAGGIAGQGISDIGEIYGTETKSLDDVRARDYLLAGAMGSGRRICRLQGARAGQGRSQPG